METLKSFASKLKPGDKYHHNLLGESLPDLLRKATAKTLAVPDDSINQQVVDTIQQEVANGKDTKEIVTLLKKRLKTDNPQKQWLAICLLQKVMPDCQNVLGMHQEELLQEAAKVMAKPARPETNAGKQARMAAKELLRRYGRAGTTAWRAAHQEVYGRPVGGGSVPAAGLPVGAIPYGYSAADYGHSEAVVGANVERQSLAEEIQLLIDKARSNTELLSDMLVNTAGGGAKDEFEQELIQDLLNEVIELRGLFNAYLEQLQAQEGADMEQLMVQALEATDLLDSCIALQKDVSSNQQYQASQGSGSGGGAGTSKAAAKTSPTVAVPAAPAAAPAPKKNDDLIALDDLADGLMSANISGHNGVPTPSDPFAASLALSPSTLSQGQPSPAQQPPGMKSAFEQMFNQPGGGNAYSALSAAAPSVPQPTPSASHPPPMPPQQPGHYSAAPYPGYAPQTTGHAYPNQAGGYYGAPGGYGVPQQGPFGAGGYHQSPAGAAQYGQPPYGQQYSTPPPVQPMQQYAFQHTGSNPFASAPAAAPAGASDRTSASGFGIPMPPTGMMGPTMMMPHNPNNPFAGSMPPPSNPAYPQQNQSGKTNSLDQEWNMFFADRAAGSQPGGAQPQPVDAQRVNADFDALVNKPTAAR